MYKKMLVPLSAAYTEGGKNPAMSCLIVILSLGHSRLPLMTVTPFLDPGHLRSSPSLQCHFYGPSIIHFLIHSYTLHSSHQVPGTQLGTRRQR